LLLSYGNISDFGANVLLIHGTTFTGESYITADDNVSRHTVQTTTVTIAEHDIIKITLD
jgi:hypothetical protein